MECNNTGISVARRLTTRGLVLPSQLRRGRTHLSLGSWVVQRCEVWSHLLIREVMGPDFSFMDDRVQCHANLMRLAMKHPAASEHEVALFLSVRNM